MSDEKFPLPGSSYKELSKIIAAYATIPGATAPGPVAQVAVVHDTVVSRNNKFLVAIGLIEGGQKKTCTSLGASLGRAIQHDQLEAINAAWQTVILQTDFLQKIISAVRIRKGMEESALASHIAFTSGSGKNAYARAGAGSVIEILKLGGSITADGSTLVAAPSNDFQSSGEESDSTDIMWVPHHSNREFGTTLLRQDTNVKRESTARQNRRDSHGGVQLNIELTITCTVSDLDGLGLKLRKLTDEFESNQPITLKVKTDDSPSAAFRADSAGSESTQLPIQDDETND